MTRKSALWLVAAVLICEGAGLLGVLFTNSSVSGWYTTLVTPALNPPGWVFGPVWTLLYALMGVSVYLVWRKKTNKKYKQAFMVFGGQLALNALWSPLFFGAQNPGLALVDIVLLLLAILWTIKLFHTISRPAAYLLIPYVAWVGFATYLNLAIWLLN
ncbi:TPA: TspO protein [Candidatus Uhrbacteria bacterium]|nr:TspO protein [Candidatus Uhrbacteria bacterium]